MESYIGLHVQSVDDSTTALDVAGQISIVMCADVGGQTDICNVIVS